MRRLKRFLLAIVVTAALVVSAFVFWFFGLAQFNDDYCITSVEIPSGETSITGPEWEFPLTYRCDYGAAGEVTVNEPIPILWSSAIAGVTVLVTSSVWWKLARSPRASKPSSRPQHEGKHRS